MAQLKATYKEILKIALPLILGNTAWTFNGVFDTIFVGNLGKLQLDAIGFGSIFYSVLFMMGFSFTRGTQIIIARRMGEKKINQVGVIVDTTLVSLLIVSTLLFFVIKMFSHDILSFMLSNEDIISMCDEFLRYRILGIVPSFITFVFIAFYSGIGRTPILAFSVFLMTVLNIVLNYALVYGKLGLPEMGIAGSGLATSIAEVFCLLLMFGGCFYKQRVHEYRLFRFHKFEASTLREMSNIAVPLMVQSFAAVGAGFSFARIETVLGKDSLAISSIFRQIILFFTIPTWSLGSTANTLISNLVGQKDFGGIKIAIRRISLVSLVMAVVSCIIIFLMSKFFIGIFTSPQDADLIPIAIHILPVTFVVLLLASFTNIIFNGVISIGDIYVALAIQVSAVIIYVIYFQVLFTFPFVNTFWIWTAEWLYWFLILVGSLLFFRFRKLNLV
ncbi:MAG: MATE family efflux transporter [Bacteroidetes bacterium]|nr:MATE family efflux transporter [Bacteroidota bacterium]